MGHEKAVRTLTFNATGSRIATGSADKMAILWDRVSGTALMKFGPHEDVVNRVAFSPDGQHLATASGFEVRIWDTQSGRMVQRLEGQLGTITAALFVPPDGSTLVTGSLDGSARVWDAATGRLLLAITMGPDDRIYGLAVTADGDHVATLGYTPQGVMIRVFPLALDHLVSVAKSLVTRTFTDEECRKYLHIDHCNGK
jgi:WD40 repeat protein